MAEAISISLTKGHAAVIDAADLPLVQGYRWTAFERSNGAVYAISKRQIDGERRTFLLHRVIMQPPPGLVVDHIDRNPLNNRRGNLRLVTQAVNSENRVIVRTGGPVYQRSRNAWQARVNFGGRRIYLGLFASHQAAVDAEIEWWKNGCEI